jgi:hypothetical protein
MISGRTMTDGSTLDAKVFVDARCESDLMARAGVKYTVGREAKSEFGEEAAGIRFDGIPRKVRTVDAQGRLLPGLSAWVKDLKEGDAHRAPMNYNVRLTGAKDPKLAAVFGTFPFEHLRAPADQWLKDQPDPAEEDFPRIL